VLQQALAGATLSQSWAGSVAEWTRRLPAQLREETDKILVAAAAAPAALRNPDGSTEARSLNGSQILRSHFPPLADTG